MSAARRPARLADAGSALDDYLGALLDDGAAATTAAAAAAFPVRLFEVAGLKLALPAAELEAVLAEARTRPCAAAPGGVVAGEMAWRQGRCQVIDLARLVLPPGRAATLDADIDARAPWRLVFDGGRRAIACDAVGDVVELEPGGVTWRGPGGRRPWLAGTVAAWRCALLDSKGLIAAIGAGMA
ncbi:MAG TPA: hypothetical protein ENK12_12485 [Gammaproteobacteria bacterium]|nr:hypothetical protein [Gammaproteobacteria bacterium]